MMRNIIPLQQVARQEVALVGSKAAHLGELSRAGIRVPNGFCIPASTFRRTLRAWGVEERLRGLHRCLRAVRLEDYDRIQALAQEYYRLLRRPLPVEIADELVRAFHRLGSAVAVRSSAPWEDSRHASFAGVFETKLGVSTPEAFLEAVTGCWASLYSPCALCYTLSLGFPIEEASMGVLILKMIPAAKAGVLYTNWDGKLLIEACAGLGEPLVSGEITPNQYLLDRGSGELLAFTPTNQRWGSFLEESGLVKRPIGSEVGRLTAAELSALRGIAHAVEEIFDGPQDVEWAIDDKGDLYVLQSRPLVQAGKGGE